MEKKWPCQSPFHCLHPLKQKWPIPKNQLMVCANCRGHSCQNTYRVDSTAVGFGLQEPFETCRGHDVSSLVRCWTLARRLCLLFYLFVADIAFAVLSLLSVSWAFALGKCVGLPLHECSKVIVILLFWQKCAKRRQTLTFFLSFSFFCSFFASLSASSTC